VSFPAWDDPLGDADGTITFRISGLVTSEQGKKLQAKVWEEVIGVLKDKLPEIV
jgi:hypothetical protein